MRVMPQTTRYGRLALWAGGILGAIKFGLVDGLFLTVGQGDLLRALKPLSNLWWVFAVAGGLAVLANNRSRLAAIVGGSQAAVSGSIPDRHEIITATNWRHQNELVFKRSLGLNLLAATAISAAATLLLKETTAVFTSYDSPLGILIIGGVVGVALLAASTRSSKDIRGDHTHRVSVRLPDLFSVHSFHVHLRQQAEDLGYTVKNDASPERSGMAAAYDDSIFLSNGGFTVRKRPIPPSESLVDDDGIIGEILSTGSVGVFAVLLGVLLYLAPGLLIVEGVGLKSPLMALSLLSGGVVLLKDYVDRTNHWAELYCVMEGTIYNPETQIHDDSTRVPLNNATPRVQDSETSCELIVTLGAGCSPSFDDHQLKQDFSDLVDSVEDLAAANQLRIVSDDIVSETGETPEQPNSEQAKSTP